MCGVVCVCAQIHVFGQVNQNFFGPVNQLHASSWNLLSIAWRKTAVTPLLTHWSYCSLAPSPQCMYYLALGWARCCLLWVHVYVVCTKFSSILISDGRRHSLRGWWILLLPLYHGRSVRIRQLGRRRCRHQPGGSYTTHCTLCDTPYFLCSDDLV